MSVCRSFFAMVRPLRAGLGCVALLPWIGVCAADLNSYRIDTWQVENGLPQSSVTSIVQTRDGYLWLGTFNGLVRFDGVQFKVFYPNSTPGLPSSRIVSLFEDRRRVLWICTEEGALVRYADGHFTSSALPNSEKRLGYVRASAEGNDGIVWMTTSEHGLVRLAAGQLSLASTNWNLKGSGVGGVAVGKAGQVWVTTEREVAAWQGDRFEPLSQKDVPPNPDFGLLYPSHLGGCWVGQDTRLRRFHDGRWVADFGRYPWTKGDLYCMLEDRDGQLWLGTYGSGLFCYSTNGKLLHHLSTEDGLPGNLVRSLYQDREDNIWVGTEGTGLARIKPAEFKVYTTKQGLSGDCVLSVCEGDDDELWIGTNGDGLNRLSLSHGTIRHYGQAEGLDNEYVWSIAQDRQHRLWVGTWGGGLFQMKDDRFVSFSNGGLVGNVVCALALDSRGSLWVGQQSPRPEILQIRSGEAATLCLDQHVASIDVRAVVEDLNGNLWVGTHGAGLYRFAQGHQTHFTRTNGLSSDFVRSLYADSEGVLWAGTYGGGLARVEADRVVAITTNDGLANDALCYITEDNQGYLWCASLGGVFRVNKQELNTFAQRRITKVRCLSFTRADGLPTLECSGGSQPSGCKTRNGFLCFPTVRGLAVVDPESVPFNPLPPSVIIEEVVIASNQTNQVFTIPNARTPAYDSEDPARQSKLEIPPGYGRLEFHYTGLSFVAPKKVEFMYQLENLDQGWIPARDRRTANYSYVPPGKYHFRVRACNNDGVWNKNGAALELVILPYFWQTPWFRVLIAVAAILLFVAIYEIRLASQRKIGGLRLRIARDLHDEVGSNLGSIALLSEVMTVPAGSTEEISEIRRIALQTIGSLRDIVWFLDPASDRMDDLVLRLKDIAKTMLPGVSFKFESNGELSAPAPSLEMRRNIFPMFKEMLHNIIKHAHATEVDIRMTITSRNFLLRVQDNGVGFAENSSHAGNGLKNLRRRAADLHGILEIQSQSGSGTRISLRAPIP